MLDPQLFDHLRSKNLQAELHSFQSVMTLCAGTPPLDEVIQVWDFLLAYGVHLNVLCVIAQLLKIREELMASVSCVSWPAVRCTDARADVCCGRT